MLHYGFILITPRKKRFCLLGGNLEVVGLAEEDNPVIYLKYLKKKIK